jgi:hypothetical protein
VGLPTGVDAASRCTPRRGLGRLNADYEACLASLLRLCRRAAAGCAPAGPAALSADRDAELVRNIDAVVDIAADRFDRLRRASDGPPMNGAKRGQTLG